MDEIYGYFPRLLERREQLAGTLSGGEQQMLAVGRAYMSEPSVMLLDEPSLGLSPQMTAQVMAVLGKLRRERGLTIVLVEQNAHAALGLADRGYLLNGGEFILEGAAANLRDNPMIQHIYLGGAASTEPLAPRVEAALDTELSDERGAPRRGLRPDSIRRTSPVSWSPITTSTTGRALMCSPPGPVRGSLSASTSRRGWMGSRMPR